ncbi:MAG: phosphopantetheine-binding protein [Myxococcota bacterium]|nr:phosphopantetheine-binding protein [Myxococcota bacterium]
MTTPQEDITAALKEFFATEVLHDHSEELEDSTPLLELGLLDSFSTIRMLSFVHKRLAIKVKPTELRVEHLQDLQHLSAFLARAAQSD